MADAVTTYTLFPEPKVGTSTKQSRRQVMKFTNISDGTGEAAVVKVNIANLVGPNGVTPTKVRIDKIQYAVFGMVVYIYADQTTDTPIAALQGTGDLDIKDAGGIVDVGTGGTGAITFTTTGHSAGDSYDITIEFIKKY